MIEPTSRLREGKVLSSNGDCKIMMVKRTLPQNEHARFKQLANIFAILSRVVLVMFVRGGSIVIASFLTNDCIAFAYVPTANSPDARSVASSGCIQRGNCRSGMHH